MFEPNTRVTIELSELVRRCLTKPSGLPLDGVSAPVYVESVTAAQRVGAMNGPIIGSAADVLEMMDRVQETARGATIFAYYNKGG